MPDPNTPVRQADWESRADGSTKGYGFLGMLQRPDGGVSSELSMGTGDVVPGREVEVPLLVPSLSSQEIQHLLTAPPGEWKHPMMKSIIQKAVDFARDRYRQGRPFFAQPDEAVDWLHPDIPRVPMQDASGDVRLPNQSGRVGR